MNTLHIVLTISAGVLAGFLNTVAGGGSLITMPVLIFLGLPSAVANGTNRIAIMAQNIVAVTNFRSKGFFDLKPGLMLALPATLGAIAGSKIAVSLPDYIFNKVLAVVMIAVMALIVFNPHKRTKTDSKLMSYKSKAAGMIVFFFIGVYGGFIQAGVGFIIIAALTFITGYSLVRINSLKVFIVAAYMLSSLAVFVLSGKINWLYGLCLASGNGLGAFLGSSFSVKKGDAWIKAVLVIAVIGMALKLSGTIRI